MLNGLFFSREISYCGKIRERYALSKIFMRLGLTIVTVSRTISCLGDLNLVGSINWRYDGIADYHSIEWGGKICTRAEDKMSCRPCLTCCGCSYITLSLFSVIGILNLLRLFSCFQSLTMSSKDGYSWTESQGLKSGVPCIGAISPPTNLKNNNTKYEVIVVGAGYCGLTAARDAAIAGKSHLQTLRAKLTQHRPQGVAHRSP